MLPAPYAQARDICERQEGTLAAPFDDDANAALVTLLAASGHDRIWIGVSDARHEGNWERRVHKVEGSFEYYEEVALEYTNWANGQPDGGMGENCVEMWTTGRWNDAPCGTPKNFACDVPQPPREGFAFACSEGVAVAASAAGPPPRCTFRVFGADGTRPSTAKRDFAACRRQCEALGAGKVAAPSTAEQTQFLARALRDSGDDSMWVGLRKVPAGWQWLASGEAVTPAAASWAHGQPDNDGECVEMCRTAPGMIGRAVAISTPTRCAPARRL